MLRTIKAIPPFCMAVSSEMAIIYSKKLDQLLLVVMVQYLPVVYSFLQRNSGELQKSNQGNQALLQKPMWKSYFINELYDSWGLLFSPDVSRCKGRRSGGCPRYQRWGDLSDTGGKKDDWPKFLWSQLVLASCTKKERGSMYWLSKFQVTLKATPTKRGMVKEAREIAIWRYGIGIVFPTKGVPSK